MRCQFLIARVFVLILPCEDGRNANRRPDCHPGQLTNLHPARENSVRSGRFHSEISARGDERCGLTALVSVATASVTNIMLKVTTISMTRACQCGPVGVVVPSTVMGCSTALSTNDAQIAPVNCAAQ
jgi:hypothetical protein